MLTYNQSTIDYRLHTALIYHCTLATKEKRCKSQELGDARQMHKKEEEKNEKERRSRGKGREISLFAAAHDFYQLDVELITSLYGMERYVRNLENLSLI